MSESENETETTQSAHNNGPRAMVGDDPEIYERHREVMRMQKELLKQKQTEYAQMEEQHAMAIKLEQEEKLQQKKEKEQKVQQRIIELREERLRMQGKSKQIDAKTQRKIPQKL